MRVAVRRVTRAATRSVTCLLLVVVACNRSDAIRADALARSEPVSVETSDGVLLEGRIFGAQGAEAGIVLTHQLGGDQSGWFDYAQRLADEGYRVITFNVRGTCPGGDGGCSQGIADVGTLPVDIAAAVGFLRDDGVDRVGLVGASMGGTGSLVAAASDDINADAVIVLSAPASIEGLDADVEVLAGLDAATLFVAGDGDVAAADAARTMYERSPQPKRLEILTTSDHGVDILSGNQGEVARSLLAVWLATHLPVRG